MFKFSFDSLVWFGEDVTASIKRLGTYGYDAIELVGEPDAYDLPVVKDIAASHGLTFSSICSIYSGARDFAHPDKKVRDNAYDYVRSVVDMAATIQAGIVTITPTPCMKTAPLTDHNQEIEWAVDGIRRVTEYAAKSNIRLVLEGWNRYEHYWLNRLEQCLELRNAVGLDNIGVMCDTFHMNIEEHSMTGAILNVKDYLYHVHLADSNRAAPGTAHLDFEPIVKTLIDIDYQGYVAFELLPAVADPFAVIRAGVSTEFKDEYAKQAITHIKAIEATIRG